MLQRYLLALLSFSTLLGLNLVHAGALADTPPLDLDDVGPSAGQSDPYIGPSAGSVTAAQSVQEIREDNVDFQNAERVRVTQASPQSAPVVMEPEPEYIPPEPYIAQAPEPVLPSDPSPVEEEVADVPPLPAPAKPENVTQKLPELEKVTFLCGDRNDIPATVAKIKGQDDLLVILWKSDFFKAAGYDAQTRCKQVSSRFAAYGKEKALTFLTAGKLSGQPVICITNKEAGDCGDGVALNNGLLFTLKSSNDSQAVLEDLAAALRIDQPERKPLEQ